MRLSSVLAPLAFLFAAATALAQTAPATPTCADLHLVPVPRECTAVRAISLAGSSLFVSLGKISGDEFVAEDLGEALGVRRGPGLSVFIRLERLAESAQAKEMLAQHHLTFDPAMHDEGYVIVPGNDPFVIK